MNPNKYFKLFPFFIIYILICLFTIIQNTYKFPNSLDLIDNNDKVFVLKDGIHFYNQNLSVEYEDKKVNFTLFSESANDNEKVSLAQFSEEQGGYIIILVMRILYIFNRDGTNPKSVNLTEEINLTHYGLTPYKKFDNKLDFIISYLKSSSIIIAKCQYNLVDNQIEIIKENIVINNSQLKGVYCIFMTPLSSLGINNDILTCFYSISNKIFTQSFNPENNYTEITDLKYNKTFSLIIYTPLYINAITNKNKQKALIYLVCQESPFWMTFDFRNIFSNDLKENKTGLAYNIHKHKLFYFSQTDEFVTCSLLQNSCKTFIMVFKNNFSLK